MKLHVHSLCLALQLPRVEDQNGLADHQDPQKSVDPQSLGKEESAEETPRLGVQEVRRKKFWWRCTSLTSTPQTSKTTRRKKTLTRQKRQLNLCPITPVMESPSGSGSLVKSRLEEVRRNTMEKSLEAVIQEAKMELEQEKRTSVRMGVSSFQKQHYQNVHRNTQNCSIDENSNIYENTSFHRKFLSYNFPNHVQTKIQYEEMEFKRLSGAYMQMTPGKSVYAM